MREAVVPFHPSGGELIGVDVDVDVLSRTKCGSSFRRSGGHELTIVAPVPAPDRR